MLKNKNIFIDIKPKKPRIFKIAKNKQKKSENCIAIANILIAKYSVKIVGFYDYFILNYNKNNKYLPMTN